MRACLAGLVLIMGTGAAAAQDGPTLSGHWSLDHKLSQDLKPLIEASAGSAQMSGGPSWATETWFPWGTSFKENERLSVRDFLLATIPVFESIEIQQGADEVKTIHGDAGSRIFHLTRASAGTSALSGEKMTRQAKLQGSQLVLESKGKEGVLRESYTLEPAGNQLVYVLHLEQKRLKKALDARLVYDRAPGAQ